MSIGSEWQQFKSSKTVKALVSIEVGAVGLFVQGIFSGTQALTLDAVKGWLLVQAGIIVAFCMRHTWAGIEAKLNGTIDPAIVRLIEEKAQARLLGIIAKKPELAKAVEDHLADTT